MQIKGFMNKYLYSGIFSWIGDLQHLAGSIFADTCSHAFMCMYKHAYFVHLFFVIN